MAATDVRSSTADGGLAVTREGFLVTKEGLANADERSSATDEGWSVSKEGSLDADEPWGVTSVGLLDSPGGRAEADRHAPTVPEHPDVPAEPGRRRRSPRLP